MSYNRYIMSTIAKDMKIAVRVDQDLGSRLKQYAKNKGLSVSALLRMFAIEKLEEEMDETEYLLSNPANAKALTDTIDKINRGEGEFVEYKNPEQLMKYVTDIARKNSN